MADRQGLSYYHYDKICSLLCFSLDDYIVVRDQLIDKDLIAFDGTFFQVLSLPRMVVNNSQKLLKNRDDMEKLHPPLEAVLGTEAFQAALEHGKLLDVNRVVEGLIDSLFIN